MPSLTHEALLLLFRNRPELAPELLRDALHLTLPAYSEVRLESADLTDVNPAEYRADLFVLLVDGKPVLGIVVEVQLSAKTGASRGSHARTRSKRSRQPRARLRCHRPASFTRPALSASRPWRTASCRASRSRSIARCSGARARRSRCGSVARSSASCQATTSGGRPRPPPRTVMGRASRKEVSGRPRAS